MLLLALVLGGAALVANTFGSRDPRISKEEAIAIAQKEAGFEPCTQQRCVLIRALSQGIPSRLVWLVGLAESLDENGRPAHVANFLVDAETGAVQRR